MTNMITNIPAPDYLDRLLCHLQGFFKDHRRDRSEFHPDTMPSFQKTPALHLRVNTYSALNFDRITLRTGMLTLPFQILTGVDIIANFAFKYVYR